MIALMSFRGYLDVLNRRRGISPEYRSIDFQPVMFDMDPFGGKKVPCTKYVPKSRFGDVGMQFQDVGCHCVRIPFAINSKPYSTRSD